MWVDSISFENSFLTRCDDLLHELFWTFHSYPCLTYAVNFVSDCFHFNIFWPHQITWTFRLPKKVSYIFTIYLKCWNLNEYLLIKGVSISFNLFPNEACHSWKNPWQLLWLFLLKVQMWIWSFHCICFSRSCLAISEYACVFSIKSSLNKWNNFFEDFWLRSFRREDLIKVVNDCSLNSW